MSIALSHQTALDVTRALRSANVNLNDLDTTTLTNPTPWKGKRWTKSAFSSSDWRWPEPTGQKPLHVLCPSTTRRLHMNNVKVHSQFGELPPRSLLWLDTNTCMVCPELLFVQMASTLSFPMLVMLGHELCGHFSRCPDEPLNGSVTTNIASATDVSRIAGYLSRLEGKRHILRIQQVLEFVADHAVSAPEASLATAYSLPHVESGYGLGPLALNQAVKLNDYPFSVQAKTRYPDLLFSFAPIGLNYDGEDDHLDLSGLVASAQQAALVSENSHTNSWELDVKLAKIREKVVDDNRRNRQLAAQGKIVFPVTKEDVATSERLDELTFQILSCANTVFGIDTKKQIEMLCDTDRKRDRANLHSKLFPNGGPWGSSYGKM